MIKLISVLTIVVLVTNLCSAFKLLVIFPITGKSHSILGEGYIKHLLKAGHEVTYITPMPIKNPSPKLQQIEVWYNFKISVDDDVLNLKKLMNKEATINNGRDLILNIMQVISNNTVMHENVQRLLHDPGEAFDAVIAEWMFSEVYAGFSSVFNCPLIWSSSMEPHQLILTLIDEDPNPAVYSSEMPPFSMKQRMENLISYLMNNYSKWRMYYTDSEIYERAFKSAAEERGVRLPSLAEAKYNGSLMLGNSHVSAGQAMRLPQNYKPIAGYHIGEVQPLPKDLQKIMDDAKHGVIYFSMGSMLKSKTLPEELKRNILEVFDRLKQTVIWKFEEHLPGLPNNVHIVNWAPQHSILAHPNCVLFISHGGLLSTTETLHFGVPIIGIPMFADQFDNVNRAVYKGFAKRVDLDLDTPVNLKAAIEDMLQNPRYSERVKELSVVYHDRPVSPAVELVHWVEHVVRTRGAPHLRSPALMVPWYQKMYLDLLVYAFLALFVVNKFIKQLLSSRIRKVSKKKNN